MIAKHNHRISEDDCELWSAFRKGDELAYTTLMRLYSNYLFRYGIRFAADEEFVKDCIQDVFLELWKRKATISQTPSVKSYLFKSLRLRIFREYPKWNKTEFIDEQNYHFAVEFNIETQLIEHQTSQENNLKLKKAIIHLAKRQKEILYLRYYENFDHERIAEVMGLNKQSTYNLLYEAIHNLRKNWTKI